MRHIVVGDVHGMLSELRLLWLNLSPKKTDQIIFLGDLIHKGPDSDGVVTFLREKKGQGYDLHVVCGNHEYKHLKDVSRQKSPWVRLHPANDFFLSLALPYHQFVSGGDPFLCVHGGVYPQFFAQYALPPYEEFKNASPDLRAAVTEFLTTRYVCPEGRPIALKKETAEDVMWPTMYDGRLGQVFYGHQPYFEGPSLHHGHDGKPLAFGMDTAACMGYWLTAAVVEEGVVSFKSQKAVKEYTQRKSVRNDPNECLSYLLSRQACKSMWEVF